MYLPPCFGRWEETHICTGWIEYPHRVRNQKLLTQDWNLEIRYLKQTIRKPAADVTSQCSPLSLNSAPWFSLCPSQREKQQERQLVVLPSQRETSALLHSPHGESPKLLLDCVVYSGLEHAVRGHRSLRSAWGAHPSTVYVLQLIHIPIELNLVFHSYMVHHPKKKKTMKPAFQMYNIWTNVMHYIGNNTHQGHDVMWK